MAALTKRLGRSICGSPASCQSNQPATFYEVISLRPVIACCLRPQGDILLRPVRSNFTFVSSADKSNSFSCIVLFLPSFEALGSRNNVCVLNGNEADVLSDQMYRMSSSSEINIWSISQIHILCLSGYEVAFATTPFYWGHYILFYCCERKSNVVPVLFN